ncbi:hypothetical protein [Ancrocorticia populi]|uniref:hypothetical protein n=1 Tax=Ancrocorticia populi TaxID=2175228 RepID=UPI003F943214
MNAKHKKDESAEIAEESREYEGPTGLPVAAGGSKEGNRGPSGLPEYAGGSHKGQAGASGLPKAAGGHEDEESEEDGE